MVSNEDNLKSSNGGKKKAPKKKKVRTTITLYPDTFATLEMLKIHTRRQGNKATFSDILAEAIIDLAQKKGLRLDSSGYREGIAI